MEPPVYAVVRKCSLLSCPFIFLCALFFFSSQHGVSDPPLLAVSEQSRRSHDHLSGQEVEGLPVSPLQAVLCEWSPHIKQHAHLAFVEIQSCVEFFSLGALNTPRCFWGWTVVGSSDRRRIWVDSVALCKLQSVGIKLTINTFSDRVHQHVLINKFSIMSVCPLFIWSTSNTRSHGMFTQSKNLELWWRYRAVSGKKLLQLAADLVLECVRQFDWTLD